MTLERQDVIDELNALMAEELEAFLRYFHLRYRLRDVERSTADGFFEKAMQETLEHAAAIALHIRTLGETPRLHVQVSADGGPASLRDVLAEALVFEQEALDAYRDMLPRVASDTPLEDFIRKQIATETEHVDQITLLLE